MENRHSYRILIILSVISLMLFIANKTGGLAEPVRGAAKEIAAKPQGKFYNFWQNLQNEFRIFSYWRNGNKKLLFLEQRNRELLVQASRVDSLEKENKLLRDQLKIDQEKKHNYILARVVGFKGDLRLDKGSKDGVKENMPVVAGNYLIGVIRQTSSGFSLVQTIMDDHSKVEAVIAGTRIKGILRGQKEESLILDAVLQKDVLKEGEEILTSGENGLIPEELITGKVKEIYKKEAMVYQTALVEPVIDIGTLKEVLIIKN